MEAPAEVGPAECVIRREGQQVMITVLGSLDRRLRKVAALRCGFCDGRQRTFEEIGREIGVSDARAGQLMASAKRVLRHPTRSRKLRDFYCD